MMARVSPHRVLPAFVLLSAGLLPPVAKSQAPGSSQVPAGWYVYSSARPDNNALHCASYSASNWMVSLDESGVRMDSAESRPTQQPALPSGLRLEPEMIGQRIVVKTPGGWLLGFDAAEFGGGLWLASEDGSPVKRVLRDSVRAIVPMRTGFLVLTGVASKDLDFGNAYYLSDPRGTSISFEMAFRLDGPPAVFWKESEDAVVLVTTRSISRVAPSGKATRLRAIAPSEAALSAYSVTETREGTIYVGMRMFVLRLLPAPPGAEASYVEQWLLPNECRRFTLHELQSECACRK